MKFKAAHDVDAPIELVFGRMCDFSQFEADVMGRGAELTRVGNWTEANVGAQWRGSVQIRGKMRKIAAEIVEREPPDHALIDITVGGMEAKYLLSFIALSPEVTRVAAELDLKPRTLTARLILQTMKLARGRVLQRMKSNLARQGNRIKAEWRRGDAG